jgi:hypothetical protein
VRKQNFAAIDLVIPMAFILNGVINEENISFIVISVKNRGGTEHVGKDYLTRESVEGVPQKKRRTRKSKHSQPDVSEEDEMHITACDKNLTLHSLTFINPEGTIGEMERSDSTWIETNAKKPYIAFMMSMGNTDQTDKFVAEKNVLPMHEPYSDVLGNIQYQSHCVCC